MQCRQLVRAAPLVVHGARARRDPRRVTGAEHAEVEVHVVGGGEVRSARPEPLVPAAERLGDVAAHDAADAEAEPGGMRAPPRRSAARSTGKVVTSR